MSLQWWPWWQLFCRRHTLRPRLPQREAQTREAYVPNTLPFAARQTDEDYIMHVLETGVYSVYITWNRWHAS